MSDVNAHVLFGTFSETMLGFYYTIWIVLHIIISISIHFKHSSQVQGFSFLFANPKFTIYHRGHLVNQKYLFFQKIVWIFRQNDNKVSQLKLKTIQEFS